jgi:hypothetical protein
VSSGDDTDFTRNAAFVKLGDFQQLPEAEQARLAPAFLEQAAPKSLDTGPINKINSEVGPITKGATGYKLKDVIVTSLEAGVLEGKGVDGKGGKGLDIWTSGPINSVLEGRGVDGKGGTSSKWREDGANRVVSGRKAGIWLQNGGTDGVADRIAECASGGNEEMKERAAPSIIAILIALFSDGVNGLQEGCANGTFFEGEGRVTDDNHTHFDVGEDEAGLLAECMESKVGDVFLKSHVKVSAADCVATVMPAISPDRAKRLGTYWRTQQQLGDGSVRF